MFKSKRHTYASAFLGPSKYLGDIGNQVKDDFFSQYRINQGTWFAGGSLMRVYHKKASVEMKLSLGRLKAADRDVKFSGTSDPNYYLYIRNLDFRTNITEFSLAGNLLPLTTFFPKKKLAQFAVQPYFTGGVGLFKFNPQGSIYDAVFDKTLWYDLQPLSTEGQGLLDYPDRKPYKLTQFNLQYGAGLAYNLGQFYYCSFSVLGRKLFTDYLDDVSTNYVNPKAYERHFTDPEQVELAQIMSNKSVLVVPFLPFGPGEKRGNDKKNDGYFSLNVSVGFIIGERKSKQSEFYKYNNNEICD